MKHQKIVFVCAGNTCRSPMAEMILKQMIKDKKIPWWKVSSCGIHAEVGSQISLNSAAALQEYGIRISKFKPTQLTQKIIEEAYLVICMTESQRQILDGCGNITSIAQLCGFNVFDPYGGDLERYRMTRDQLITACEIIIEKIILKSGDTLL